LPCLVRLRSALSYDRIGHDLAGSGLALPCLALSCLELSLPSQTEAQTEGQPTRSHGPHLLRINTYSQVGLYLCPGTSKVPSFFPSSPCISSHRCPFQSSPLPYSCVCCYSLLLSPCPSSRLPSRHSAGCPSTYGIGPRQHAGKSHR
jgi:hypothetical protein